MKPIPLYNAIYNLLARIEELGDIQDIDEYKELLYSGPVEDIHKMLSALDADPSCYNQ